MKERSNYNAAGDFTSGRIMPMLVRFILPILAANILNSLYNTVDTAIIGRFAGSIGMVAVSSGGRVLTLITQLCFAFSGAGQIYISQLFGAKDRAQQSRTAATLIVSIIAGSAAISVVMLILSGNIVQWLNVPDEACSEALVYLRVTCAGFPLICGYNALSGMFHGVGDSKDPLLFITVAAVTNIAGDLLFIGVFGMGAVGAALATVMSQALSFFLALFVMNKKKESFGFDIGVRDLKIQKKAMKTILKLGIPFALRSCCIFGTQLVLTGYVNTYDLAGIAAYAIADKIFVTADVFANAAGQAAGNMAGQNIGAEKPGRVRQVVRCTALISLISSAVIITIIMLLSKEIFSLFTKEADVLAYTPVMMPICCLVIFLSSLLMPFEAVVIGTGNSSLRFISGILDGLILRVFLSILFVHYMNMRVPGFFLADALARTGPIAISVWYYASGSWKKRKKL